MKPSRLLDLVQEVTRALDGTRYKLREKAHKEQVVRQVPTRLDLPSENIDHVGGTLKSVKRDPDRQKHGCIFFIQPGEADGVQDIQHVATAEEIQILAEEQDAEVHSEREG
jgi:hypothetical protein